MGFITFFSLLSVAAITWLILAFSQAEFQPLWSPPAAMRTVALVLMLFAFLFVVIGLLTPNPTVLIVGESLDHEDMGKGIVRITRHPFMWGVVTWGLAHLLANGDEASMILFGSLTFLAGFGPFSIDQKYAKRLGVEWEDFVKTTSNVPFAAITQGRNSWPSFAEIGWMRIAVALLTYLGFLALHPVLFGVSPLP